MIPAREALERLREGNRRFVAETRNNESSVAGESRRRQLASGQEPFAIILGCSDSRVPAELEVSARTADGEVMAVRHASLPIEGVQFHPESILTPRGPRMLENFLRATQ